MLLRNRSLSIATAVAGTLLVSTLGIGPAAATTAAQATRSGATATTSPSWSTHVCRGTARKPGVLAGLYWDVVVRGVCFVNHGPAIIRHDAIVTDHSSLIAAFGRWHSRVFVGHNVLVLRRGTLLLGCEPKAFPCFDDPHPKKPRLTSHDVIGGSLVAIGALGVVVHVTRIGGNVVQLGGGGGLTCKPMGVFAAFHSPVYSTYEDNWIGGSIWVKRVRSCWLGVIRNWIGGSATVSHDKMADPDAMEVVSNVVHKDLTCWRNRPRVQFGDSHGTPNLVGLHAFFECGFHVILPNPSGQHVHFSHISVRLH